MPIPPFVALLRRKIGHDLLWMPGITAVVLRDRQGQPGHTSTAEDAADPGQSLEVLLIKRSDTGAWTPVTGITDPGEHPHDTAEREVLEVRRQLAAAAAGAGWSADVTVMSSAEVVSVGFWTRERVVDLVDAGANCPPASRE